MDEPLLSIACISYNHEKYIAQAIESWLMQRTNFEVEIVIGEDNSTDKTLLIVQKYIDNYPDKIQLITSLENVGMMSNFVRTLIACKGKYIAICEGDDYWTDPFKLQKQVDFLEANSEVALCFHNSIIENTYKGLKELFHKSKMPNLFSGGDLLKRWLIPTASVVMRNIIPDQFPSFITKATHGDLALFLFASQYGKIAMLPDVMSVYRLNETGVTNNFKGINHNLAHIEQCELMRDYFKPNFQKLLSKRISNYFLSTARLSAQIGNKRNAIKFLFKAFLNYPLIIILNLLDFLKLLFELIMPLKNE